MGRATVVLVVILTAIIGYFFLRTMARQHARDAEHIIKEAVMPVPPEALSRRNEFLTRITQHVGGVPLRLLFGLAFFAVAMTCVVVAALIRVDPSTHSVSVVNSVAEITFGGPTFVLGLLFALEQIVNGIAFDFFETFGLKVMAYDPADTSTASVVFITRTVGQLYLTSALAGLAVQRSAIQVVQAAKEWE